VAVDMAETYFPTLQECRVLLIGAGDIGRVVAKTFVARQVKELVIANRSLHKAEMLAHEIGGTAISLEQINDYLEQIDIIVSGTGSPNYLLRYADVEQLYRQREGHPLMLVDIALPRDFDPQIGTLPNVLLKNLYDLREIVDANLKKREDEVPKVQAIVDDEVQKFLDWKDSLKINGTIKTLNLSFNTIRNEELERYQHQFSEDVLPQVDAFTKSLTKKYLHLIISNIKSLYEVCDLDERQMHILQHLFDSHGATDEKPTRCRNARQHPGT
jgi:glutamyl-tRNA reductase